MKSGNILICAVALAAPLANALSAEPACKPPVAGIVFRTGFYNPGVADEFSVRPNRDEAGYYIMDWTRYSGSDPTPYDPNPEIKILDAFTRRVSPQDFRLMQEAFSNDEALGYGGENGDKVVPLAGIHAAVWAIHKVNPHGFGDRLPRQLLALPVGVVGITAGTWFDIVTSPVQGTVWGVLKVRDNREKEKREESDGRDFRSLLDSSQLGKVHMIHYSRANNVEEIFKKSPLIANPPCEMPFDGIDQEP